MDPQGRVSELDGFDGWLETHDGYDILWQDSLSMHVMQPDGTARQIYQSDAGYVRVISAAFDGHYAWFALSKNHEGKLEFAILLVEPRTRKTWALGAEDGFAGLVPTPSRNAPTMPKVVVAPIAVGKAIMFGTGKGQRIGVAELGDRDAIRFRVIPISGEWDVRDLQPIRALSLWSEGQSMDSEAARVLVEYETPSPGWILIDPKSFDVTVLEADRYDHAYGLWQNGSYYYVKVLDRSSRRPPRALVRLDWSAANPELLLEGVVGDCSHRPRAGGVCDEVGVFAGHEIAGRLVRPRPACLGHRHGGEEMLRSMRPGQPARRLLTRRKMASRAGRRHACPEGIRDGPDRP